MFVLFCVVVLVVFGLLLFVVCCVFGVVVVCVAIVACDGIVVSVVCCW